MSSRDKGGFGWFLLGLGVGTAVGVLYAPKPGSETRDELASTAREKSEFVRQRARQAGDLVDRGRDQLNEYVDRSKDAVDRGRAQWDQYVDRGRQLAQDQAGRVSSAVEEGKRAYSEGGVGEQAEKSPNAV